MKKITLFLVALFAVLTLTLTACTPNANGGESTTVPVVPNIPTTDDESDENTEFNVLIAYFSLTEVIPEGANASSHATPYVGNTESVAREIQSQIGGDLFKIQTVQTYPTSHSECSRIAEQEMRSDARPELSSHVEGMADYDIVFVGYPIWWYQEPMAIRTFLEEYDFEGKTIVPFCTTMSAGIEQSIRNINNLCPDTTVVNGYTFRTGRADNSAAVTDWLTQIGMLNQEA